MNCLGGQFSNIWLHVCFARPENEVGNDHYQLLCSSSKVARLLCSCWVPFRTGEIMIFMHLKYANVWCTVYSASDVLPYFLTLDLPGSSTTFHCCATKSTCREKLIKHDCQSSMCFSMMWASVNLQHLPVQLFTQNRFDVRLTLDDAEQWNGHGDLMHSPFSREHLSLEKMDPVTLYSVTLMAFCCYWDSDSPYFYRGWRQQKRHLRIIWLIYIYIYIFVNGCLRHTCVGKNHVFTVYTMVMIPQTSGSFLFKSF